MNLIPVRTAVIAGTCAIALSFVAVPAFAEDGSSSMAASPEPGDGSTMGDDGSEAGDGTEDSTDESSDDSTGDTADDGIDDGSDADDPAATTATPPAEHGTPRHHLRDGTLEPREVVKKGIRVEYTGLTAHASYQPFYSTGQSGGSIGDPVEANGKGTIVFTWHPASGTKNPFAHAGARYSLGLMGTDTQLSLLDEITVGYDSDLVWKPAKRHHGTVTLEVHADHAKPSGSKDAAWKKVRVEFQKKVGDTWVTVTTKKTNAHGVAKAVFVAGKHVWRAVVESKGTVLGSTTKGHKK